MGFLDFFRPRYFSGGGIVQPVTAPVDRLATNSASAGIERSLKDVSGLDLNDDAVRAAKLKADSGLPMTYYRYILKGVLRDGHIGGILADLMQRSVAYPFDIELFDEVKENPAAQAQADFLKAALSGFNFDQVREKAAWGTFWPTLQEVVYSRSSDRSVSRFFDNSGLPGFEPVVPVLVTPLPNLYLQSDEHGNLLYIQDDGRVINLTDEADRFIIAINPADAEHVMIKPIPFTEIGSQARIFDEWVGKVYARLDGRRYRNRFAEPMLDVRHDPEDANAKKAADTIYNAYNSNGKLRSMSHPSSVEVGYVGGENVARSSLFREDVLSHNSEATKGLKGQDMSTEKDSTRATSATGMLYDDELLKSICSIRDTILNDQLVLPLRDMNFSAANRFPLRLVTRLPEEFDASERIGLVESASAMGRVFSEGELNELYRLPQNPERELVVLKGLANTSLRTP